MRHSSLWSTCVAIMLIAILSISGCQTSTNNAQNNGEGQETEKAMPAAIALGTFPTGGSSYMVATGVAKVLTDHLPTKVLTRPSAGPVAFNPLLETGELGLAIESGNDLAWAFSGGTGYERVHKNLRVLARGHGNPTIPLVVGLDSGINSIADLQGKRVAGEYGSFITAKQSISAALESVGMTWDDVTVIPVADATSGMRALQEGLVDAAFCGTPKGSLNLEVDASKPLKALSYGDLSPVDFVAASPEMLHVLQQYLPGATIYLQQQEGFLKSDCVAINFVSWLAASALLDEDAAYEITKTVYEYSEELHPLHDFLMEWRQETMFGAEQPAPYHEGAIRYWKEIGLWTPEAEETQRMLLEQVNEGE